MWKSTVSGAGYYPVISGGHMGLTTAGYVSNTETGISVLYVTRSADAVPRAGSRFLIYKVYKRRIS